MTRKQARRIAFSLLYQIPFCRNFDLNKALLHILENIDGGEIDSPESLNYIIPVVLGVQNNLIDIDMTLSKHLRGWDIDRICTVDLAILRLAVCELTGHFDIPESVVINEAVGIAKEFGTDDSGSFVNGVLASLVNDVER